MGRKSKYSYETKLSAVQAYEQNQGGRRNIADRFGVSESTFRVWWMVYQSSGADGLAETHRNKQWNKEVKLAAINDYLFGVGSVEVVCKKYKISSTHILRNWIKVYNNSHKELKSTGLGGKKPMTKGRKTTFDERLEIIQYCIANSRNYGAAMDKYNVSYQQIYLWVKKYDEKGINGLLDRRGMAKPEFELTEADRLRAENKMLEAKNVELEMENRLLKKLQEVERRRR